MCWRWATGPARWSSFISKIVTALTLYFGAASRHRRADDRWRVDCFQLLGTRCPTVRRWNSLGRLSPGAGVDRAASGTIRKHGAGAASSLPAPRFSIKGESPSNHIKFRYVLTGRWLSDGFTEDPAGPGHRDRRCRPLREIYHGQKLVQRLYVLRAVRILIGRNRPGRWPMWRGLRRHSALVRQEKCSL